MEVKTFSYYDESNYVDLFRMEINGHSKFHVGNGEPEDMTVGRDLGFAICIDSWLKAAHMAGKNGESFEYEHVECKSRDEFWGD